jgi:hypothetical protein
MSNAGYVRYLIDLTRTINIYVPLIFQSIEIVLNCITAAIFLRQRMRKKSNMTVCYVMLAIYDNLALLNPILFAQSFPNLGIFISNISEAICKFSWVYRRAALQSPSWVFLFFLFFFFTRIINFCSSCRLWFLSLSTDLDKFAIRPK